MTLSIENTTLVSGAVKMVPTNTETSMPMANVKTEVVRGGISFGTALAIVISWTSNHSILWAVIHGLLSWLYVIYYLIRYY